MSTAFFANHRWQSAFRGPAGSISITIDSSRISYKDQRVSIDATINLCLQHLTRPSRKVIQSQRNHVGWRDGSRPFKVVPCRSSPSVLQQTSRLVSVAGHLLKLVARDSSCLSLSRKEHKHCIDQIETTKLLSLGEQAKTLIWPNLDDMHVIVYCGAVRNHGTTLHHLKNKSVLSI